MIERIDPELRVGERETLTQFLDFLRASMVRLAEGLSQEQLATTLPPSDLTIAGLLKHLALVEDSWFQEDMLGRPIPAPFDAVDWAADPDWEFRTALDDRPEYLIGRYLEACERSRQVVAEHDLSEPSVSVSPRTEPGTHYSLRWIVVHLIEETARHLGHADLIRQAIDGATDL